MRLLFANTVPVGLSVHARGQLQWLAQQGIEVIAVTSPGLGVEDLHAREHVEVSLIPMEREIAPFKDLRSLLLWLRAIRVLHPDVVVYGSPKASLLGSIASRLMRVRRRVYIAHGARFEGARGAKRSLLLLAEAITCALSDEVLAVSDSVRRLFLESRLAPPSRITVVHGGSCNGVDATRFSPVTGPDRSALRRRYGLHTDASIVGFVGRMTSEKGLDQLAKTAEIIERGLAPDRHLTLLVAGWREDAGLEAVRKRLNRTEVRYLGYVREVEDVYRICDVMLLPTRREGLPSSVLEAAACGVPTVAYAVTGTVDAVVDGETGYLVEQGDVRGMARRALELVEDKSTRDRMGSSARRHVVATFGQEGLWPALMRVYLGPMYPSHDPQEVK